MPLYPEGLLGNASTWSTTHEPAVTEPVRGAGIGIMPVEGAGDGVGETLGVGLALGKGEALGDVDGCGTIFKETISPGTVVVVPSVFVMTVSARAKSPRNTATVKIFFFTSNPPF